MKYLSYLIITVAVIVCSCNDSIEIGNSLLEDEEVGVMVDTLRLEAQTVLADSVLTFRRIDGNFSNSTYMVGQLNDAQFGQSEATAFFSPSLIQQVPNLDTFVIDSVVMTLKLDSSGQYGNPNVVHNLQLFELTEAIVPDSTGATLYSFDDIPTQGSPLLTLSKVIDYNDSIEIESYTDTITLTRRPQIRFQMDVQRWTDLLTSRDSITTTEVLEELIPGYALKSTVDNSMLGLDLGFSTNTSEVVFYMYSINSTDSNDTLKREYRLPLGRLRHNNFSHDYAGSAASAALSDANSPVLFLESQGGTDIEIDLESIRSLGDNVVLNSALIEMAVIDSYDEEIFPSPDAVFASFINNDGVNTTLIDILIQEDGFRLIERAGVEYYVMDITRQANLILDGEVEASKIKIFTNAKAQRANRAIIGGPDHPEFPMQMKVVKTNP